MSRARLGRRVIRVTLESRGQKGTRESPARLGRKALLGKRAILANPANKV